MFIWWSEFFQPNEVLRSLEKTLPADLDLVTWGYLGGNSGIVGKYGVPVDYRNVKKSKKINRDQLRVPDDIAKLIRDILNTEDQDDSSSKNELEEINWEDRRKRIADEVTPAINQWFESISVPACKSAYLSEEGDAFTPYRGSDISREDVLITWAIEDTHVLKPNAFKIWKKLGKPPITIEGTVWQ